MPNKIHTSIIIGTGFSGLAMAIQLKKKGIHDFIILEKTNEIGGTWRENTYPGAECDVPSALYSFSFEPYPFWEYKWSLQAQILQYIKHVAEKYDLNRHIHFAQEMTAAEWSETENIWRVTTKANQVFQTKTLITAIGQLHHPSTPNFSGKALFEKPNWHSARWNHTVDLAGKTVGVIGNAASATQFIPEIAKTADKVIVFQRSANWMLPKQDRAYKSWEKKLVAQFPILLKMYRLKIWLLGGALYLLMKNGNHLLRKIFQYKSIRYIKENIKDPKIAEQLTPKYPMGAKRVLFSDTYYQALAKNNVELITNNIETIKKSSISTTDGRNHELDVLIYATGFKTNPFLADLNIQGKQGVSIQEYWKDNTKNYLGMTMENFPNLFLMYGPNTNLGHNSIIVMSEAQADYITQCVSALEKNNWKSLEIKAEILQNYYQKTQHRLKNMIWSTIENSWYQSANGSIPNNYPGRTMEYMRVTKRVDFSDFYIKK